MGKKVYKSDRQSKSKSFDISEAIVSLADNENCSVVDIICFIATRFYHQRNKKLHFIFQELTKKGENFFKQDRIPIQSPLPANSIFIANVD